MSEHQPANAFFGLFAVLATAIGLPSVLLTGALSQRAKPAQNTTLTKPSSESSSAPGLLSPIELLQVASGNSELSNEQKPGPTKIELSNELFSSRQSAESKRSRSTEPPPARSWESVRAEVDEFRFKKKFADVEVDFLIATVPDPIDSHLMLSFDNQLAAIQSALGQHAYVLERYSLPWKNWLKDRGTNADSPRDYREHAGILLFRKISDDTRVAGFKQKFMIVLLVGETPTAGIHKQAMAESLDYAAAWQAKGDSTVWPSLTIVGPSYSGSSASLRTCLQNWHRERSFTQATIRICSGGATARGNQKILHFPQRMDGLLLTFEATVHPDDVALRQMRYYLVVDRKIPLQKIALLSESGTVYGRSPGSAYDKSQESAYDRSRKPSEDSDGFIHLKYPMQIGRLRSEYDKNPQLKYGPVVADVPRSSLELSFDETVFATDVLPSFSQETIREAERQLAAVLSTMSRRDVRAMGIMGTDVNDILFMAQQVRNYAPDVQLFVLTSDLLYGNPDYLRYTEGMLVASTYPLFPNNQTWTGQEPHGMETFPSGEAEGVYNATLVQLNQCLGAPRQALCEYHTPFVKDCKPPLWLTMVGRDGLWPVRAWQENDLEEELRQYMHSECDLTVAFTEDPKQRDCAGEKLELTVPTFSIQSLHRLPSGINVFVSALVADICVLLLMFRNPPLRFVPRRRLEDTKTHWYSGIWGPFAPLPIQGGPAGLAIQHVRRRNLSAEPFLLCAAFFLGLLLVHLYFSAPLWRVGLSAKWRGATWESREYQALFLLSLSGLTFGLLTATILRLCSKSISRRRARTSSYARALSLAVVLGLLGVVAWIWLQPKLPVRPIDRINAAIYAERVGTYTSGVSPLVPSALLAGILSLWGICHLRRLHFLNYFGIHSPFSADGTPRRAVDQHTAGIDARIDALHEPLEASHFWPQRLLDWLFLVSVGISLIYVFGVRWTGTPEGRPFDWYFIASAVIAVTVIAVLHVRVMAVCGLFERLLRRLGQHAMSSELKHVPRRLASKASGSIFSAAPHPGDMEPSVRLLEQITEAVGSKNPELHSVLLQRSKTVRDRLIEIMSFERPLRIKAFEYAGALNRELALASNDLTPYLSPVWSKRGILPKPDDEKPESACPLVGLVKPEPSWTKDAEMFVLLQIHNLIRQVFAQIQNMLTFLVLMALMLVWALNSYPFQPQRLLMVFSFALVLWIVATLFVVLIKFNRDEVLSKLAGTAPNQFTFDRSLTLPLATYVVIPLLSLAAIQFPEISNGLFSWIAFVQRALHG